MKFVMLELRPYMLDVNDDLYEMFQEIPAKDEFGQTNEYFGKTKEQIKKQICAQMQTAYSLNLSRNVLPSEVYILYVDDKPVSIGGLRLKLNNYWTRHSGNIWYKTRPSERHKGYATMFVKMLCERAKELSFTEVLAQCNKNNLGSNKVLKNNNFRIYENPLCLNFKNTNYYKKKM